MTDRKPRKAQPPRIPTLPANLDWQARGACVGEDPELFFHPEGSQGTARRVRAAEAARICRRCPVSTECYDAALRNGEAYGVWGGTDLEAASAGEPPITLEAVA